MSLRGRLASPGVSATGAHVLAWAFAAFVLVVVGLPEDSTLAIIVVAAPILATTVALACALWERDHRVVWGLAIGVAGLAYLSIATVGLLLAPVAAVLFWASHVMAQRVRRSD